MQDCQCKRNSKNKKKNKAKNIKLCKLAFVFAPLWNGKMQLTFVDVQHEAIEVYSLFTTVFHVGKKQIHEHGLPCA